MNERDTYTIVMGSMLVLVGAALLLDRTGVITWTARWSIWWLLLVAFGVAQMAASGGRRGLFTTILGIWLFATESRWISAVDTWPLLLVGLGAGMAWQGLRPEPEPEPAVLDASGKPVEGSAAPVDWTDREARRRYRAERRRYRRHRGFSPVIALLAIFAIANVFSRERRDLFARSGDDATGQLRVFSVLGGSRRMPEREFRGGEIITVLGGNDVDLRRAEVPAGQDVTLDVFTIMGGSTIRVPENWTVDLQARAVLGDIRDSRARGSFDRPALTPPGVPAATPQSATPQGGAAPSPAPQLPAGAAPPRLVVRGYSIMGGVVIK